MMASSGFGLMAAASRTWRAPKTPKRTGKAHANRGNRSPACAASLCTDFPQRAPEPPRNDERGPVSLTTARLSAWLLCIQRTSHSVVDSWPAPGGSRRQEDRRRHPRLDFRYTDRVLAQVRMLPCQVSIVRVGNIVRGDHRRGWQMGMRRYGNATMSRKHTIGERSFDMTKRVGTLARAASAGVSALAIALLAGMAISPNAVAGEAEAKALLKAMSTYMAEQIALSFEYDATLEVVTRDKQKLALASSGAVALSRPDKIRATRSGGFLDTETVFDGRTLTLLGKNKNIYTQIDIPGSIDHLVDELKDKYNRPLPAADLLLTNAYDELMSGVVDVKDLGSGVIGGTECDHLAFRKREVDLQIWIAQGDRPYPCRYVITSRLVENAPQYSVQIRNWKTGGDSAADAFSFKAPPGARQVDLKDLQKMKDMGELPSHFVMGGK